MTIQCICAEDRTLMSIVAQQDLTHYCCLQWEEGCGFQKKIIRALKNHAKKYLTISFFSSETKMAKPKAADSKIQMWIWLSGFLWTSTWVLNWDELPILSTKLLHYLNEDCHSIPSCFHYFTWMWNVFIFYCCYKISSKQKLQTPQGNYILPGKNTFIIFTFTIMVHKRMPLWSRASCLEKLCSLVLYTF